MMLRMVQEVFSKEFRQDVEYVDFMHKRLDAFKLNNNCEKVENIVERLKNNDFESNFDISLGETR